MKIVAFTESTSTVTSNDLVTLSLQGPPSASGVDDVRLLIRIDSPREFKTLEPVGMRSPVWSPSGRSSAGAARLIGVHGLMGRFIRVATGTSLAFAIAGCSDGGSDQTHMMVAEFDGVVVTAEVPGRITGTDTRLVTFTVENRSNALTTVWLAFAVDALDPGCVIANTENWSDLEAQASGAERFPLTRLQAGESSRGALNTLVSPDCIGTTVDVVMVTGSPDPNGEFVSERTNVEIG